jgi:hypothetical protein
VLLLSADSSPYASKLGKIFFRFCIEGDTEENLFIHPNALLSFCGQGFSPHSTHLKNLTKVLQSNTL